MGQLDLYRKYIPLSSYRVPYDQEADIFVVERVEFSEFCVNAAYSNIVIRAIIIIITILLRAQVSYRAIVVIIEAKVGISPNFSVVKALIVHIIGVSFIIVNARSLPPLLCVDQLRRPTTYSEEEKQYQWELYAMLLCREG
jgi:hypothetical protein